MFKLRGMALVGGLGAAAVLGVFVMLQVEKSAHASTLQTLANREIEMSQYATTVAEQAAESARVVAAAVEAERMATADFEQREQALRLAVDTLRDQSVSQAARSDQAIGRLLRENDELRAWADTRIPDDWVAWLRGEFGADPTSGAATGH